MTPSLNPEEARLDPALAALAAGSKVGGERFTLLRLLGQGGMAVVWLARDEHLHEDVALKFLPPEIRRDAVALDDLRRETSRSRKLTHPNIIRIHDLYKADNEAFISMEYVEGANLSELRLQQPERVFQWSFLEPLVKQLCDALEYAHGERVIHRDLKPANMMLDGRGRVKLADFGLAATVSDSLSRVSMGNHAFSGTASYMSPQQLDGQMPQVTDDVYSLGSTLYELLTSRAPFFTGDIAHQVRSVQPQPLEKRLSQLRIDNPVPSAVSSTIMACLSKEPQKRPQTARAVAEKMGFSVREGERMPLPAINGTDAQAAATGPATTTQDTPENQTPGERVHAPEGVGVRKSRVPVLAAIAIIALLAITGVGWWWAQHRAPSNTTQIPQTPRATQTTPAEPPKPVVSEFISIFNGRDLSEWNGDEKFWKVQDGAIVAIGGTSKEKRPEAIFWRGGMVQDFELRLSFKLESGNSGVYFRAKRLEGHEVGGYQFEIAGDNTGSLLETGSDRFRREPCRRGFVTTAAAVESKGKLIDKLTVEKPLASVGTFHSSQWNEVIIIAQGNHVTHKLNGREVIETTDEYEQRPRSGMVALEVYGARPTTARFRDIRLKRLPPSESTNAPALK